MESVSKLRKFDHEECNQRLQETIAFASCEFEGGEVKLSNLKLAWQQLKESKASTFDTSSPFFKDKSALLKRARAPPAWNDCELFHSGMTAFKNIFAVESYPPVIANWQERRTTMSTRKDSDVLHDLGRCVQVPSPEWMRLETNSLCFQDNLLHHGESMFEDTFLQSSTGACQNFEITSGTNEYLQSTSLEISPLLEKTGSFQLQKETLRHFVSNMEASSALVAAKSLELLDEVTEAQAQAFERMEENCKRMKAQMETMQRQYEDTCKILKDRMDSMERSYKEQINELRAHIKKRKDRSKRRDRT